MAPDPIPLRTLTVLLNYERSTTDPRFKDTQLACSTHSHPSLINTIKPELKRAILDQKPPTIQQTKLHMFVPNGKDVAVTEYPSLTCSISADAEPEVHALTSAEREIIYHESHDHDGCYKAIALFQHFFEICPPDQMLFVQIKGEEPVLIPTAPRIIMEFTMTGPKLLSITTVLPEGPSVVTGSENKSPHSVMGFGKPGSDQVDYVVDMTSMQWGEAGRGRYGEPYFLGDVDEFEKSMRRVCDELALDSTAGEVAPSEHTALLKECAQRVMERWNNRETEGWCVYCGKGGPSLLRCTGCKLNRVWYCCKEHQVSDWKLHKHTCEKGRAK